MLSRIIRRDEAQSANPLLWPAADGTRSPESQSAVAPGQPAEQVAGLERALAELKAEMERRVREAGDTARREGEAAARKQAAAEIQAVLGRLGAAVQEAAAVRDRLRRESETDLVKLAVAIAQRILNRQLSVDPDAITGIIKAGFEKLKRQDIFRVRVHPSHHAALCSLLPASGTQGIELLADPALQPGGVIFETSRGDLEASVDTQLREIERGLTDRLEA